MSSNHSLERTYHAHLTEDYPSYRGSKWHPASTALGSQNYVPQPNCQFLCHSPHRHLQHHFRYQSVAHSLEERVCHSHTKNNITETQSDLRNISCTMLASKMYKYFVLDWANEQLKLGTKQYGGVITWKSIQFGTRNIELGHASSCLNKTVFMYVLYFYVWVVLVNFFWKSGLFFIVCGCKMFFIRSSTSE